LRIYAPPEGVVYDPFCGTGTTANACREMGIRFIGSEISKAQWKYSVERIGGAINE
jgi:site-specific DNA-methyltransferase (adenine-specific)